MKTGATVPSYGGTVGTIGAVGVPLLQKEPGLRIYKGELVLA